jgi:integrase/recombinase XerD
VQPQRNRLTTPQALDGFLLALAAEGRSRKTLADYRYSIGLLVAWLHAQGRGEAAVDDVTTEDVRRFFADIRQRQPPLGAKTIKNVDTALRSFWTWLGHEFGLRHILKGAIKRPKANPPAFQLPSREQIDALLKACDRTRPARSERRKSYRTRRPTARRDRAIILTLLDTGLRAQELCSLTLADVDLETGGILVRHGKGDKPRMVYAGKATRRALWRYKASKRQEAETDAPFFVTHDGRPLTTTQLSHLIMHLGRRAGVKVWPHLLRHVFATEFLRAGGSTLALRRLLGHVSEAMLERYVELAECDLRAAHAEASPADRWRL